MKEKKCLYNCFPASCSHLEVCKSQLKEINKIIEYFYETHNDNGRIPTWFTNGLISEIKTRLSPSQGEREE
jgi:hypothetical protein